MNPGLGLTPFLIFFIVYWITERADCSLIYALVFGVIAEPLLRWYNKVPKSGIGFYLVIFSFALTLVTWIFLNKHINNNRLYSILPELILVIVLMVMRFFKSLLSFRFFRKHDAVLKIFLSEFFDMAVFVQYFFTIHIFISIIYMTVKENWMHDLLLDKVVFLAIPFVGIILLIVYGNIKLSKLSKKLRREEWLPIVTEKGEVTGKIAKSMSFKMDNKFLHPVVRIALVYDGQIYLQKRNANDILDPKALDHPFEKYILFKHEINIAARNSIVKMIGKDLPIHFLLKYTFENEKTKRLIFLFVARLKDESDLEDTKSLIGKFWTTKQIEADFGDDTMFSECFQLEYEYLKNTVLAPDEFVNNIDHTQSMPE